MTKIEIRKKVQELKKMFEVEDKRHERITEAIKLSLKDVQKQCNHKEKEYIPDPSGNSGSYYTCKICDAEVI
jgi:hypothetical protein